LENVREIFLETISAKILKKGIYKALGIFEENTEWKDNGGYKLLAANVIRAGVRDEVSQWAAAKFYEKRSDVRT
jgi:hypothetical protein